ncbi:hypothetical protein BU15DRAFT_84325 [Melanogaster broomeanus]|nr:hypothetical protein BU15DRAFT_84325 [Melanogaster broomeanus]
MPGARDSAGTAETGKFPSKATLLHALDEWCSVRDLSNRVENLDLGTNVVDQPSRESVVLGDAVLLEIWKDQERLELPSFVSPAPARFGSEKRTLSADQWRSVGTIHLVITLIRLWGFEKGPTTTSEEDASDYMVHMKAYLHGFVQLYKEAKVQPTHHLSLHLGKLLVLFGPNTKTNKRFGELELTFMNDACRAANLAAYLFNSSIPKAVKDIWPPFQHAFRSDIRGTRLNDIMAFGASGKARLYIRRSGARGRQAEEDNKYLSLAMKHLGTNSSSGKCVLILRVHSTHS